MKFYETAEFKRLEKEWYAKLAEQQFQDIEDSSRAYRPIKDWHCERFLKIPQSYMHASEDYYRKAEELLKYFQFASEMERLIWELHSTGASSRAIEKAIAPLPGAYKREWINVIVTKIAREIK